MQHQEVPAAATKTTATQSKRHPSNTLIMIKPTPMTTPTRMARHNRTGPGAGQCPSMARLLPHEKASLRNSSSNKINNNSNNNRNNNTLDIILPWLNQR